MLAMYYLMFVSCCLATSVREGVNLEYKHKYDDFMTTYGNRHENMTGVYKIHLLYSRFKSERKNGGYFFKDNLEFVLTDKKICKDTKTVDIRLTDRNVDLMRKKNMWYTYYIPEEVSEQFYHTMCEKYENFESISITNSGKRFGADIPFILLDEYVKILFDLFYFFYAKKSKFEHREIQKEDLLFNFQVSECMNNLQARNNRNN